MLTKQDLLPVNLSKRFKDFTNDQCAPPVARHTSSRWSITPPKLDVARLR